MGRYLWISCKIAEGYRLRPGIVSVPDILLRFWKRPAVLNSNRKAILGFLARKMKSAIVTMHPTKPTAAAVPQRTIIGGFSSAEMVSNAP